MRTIIAGVVVLLLTLASRADTAETLKDGVFAGESYGYKGLVRVAVTIKDGAIEKVEVTGQRESRPRSALTTIPSRIISKNSAQVDAVTGATITSDAIMSAVRNAIEQVKK